MRSPYKLHLSRPAVAVLACALLLLASCDSPQVEAPRTEPSPAGAVATPTPGQANAEPTAETTPASPATPRALAIDDRHPIPFGMAVLYTRSCGVCSPDGVYRTYRDSSGEVRNEQLLATDAKIMNLIASDEGLLVAALCRPAGKCDKHAWLDGLPPDIAGEVIISRDGGVTWEQLETSQGALPLIVVQDNVIAIAGHFPNSERKPEWVLHPSGARFAPPPGANPASAPRLVEGRLQWQTEAGDWIENDGSPALTPALPAALLALPGFDPERAAVREVRGALLAVWGDGTGQRSIVAYQAAGAEIQLFDLIGSVRIATWDGGPIAFADVTFGPEKAGPLNGPRDLAGVGLIAMVEPGSASIIPLGEPLIPNPDTSERLSLLWVQTGNTARVVTGDSCLNVRETAAATGEVLGCFADGVLLGDLGQTREADGLVWLHVRTPAGQEGWASLQYLERNRSQI